MKARATIGYVITNGGSVCAVSDYGDGLVLTIGGVGTVFRERRQAIRAIERSNLYVTLHRLPWDRDHKISRLVPRD